MIGSWGDLLELGFGLGLGLALGLDSGGRLLGGRLEGRGWRRVEVRRYLGRCKKGLDFTLWFFKRYKIGINFYTW